MKIFRMHTIRVTFWKIAQIESKDLAMIMEKGWKLANLSFEGKNAVSYALTGNLRGTCVPCGVYPNPPRELGAKL